MVNLQALGTGLLLEHFKNSIEAVVSARLRGVDKAELSRLQNQADLAETEIEKRCAW